MHCNFYIHNELIEMGEYCCPFCDLELMEVDIKHQECCIRIVHNCEIIAWCPYA